MNSPFHRIKRALVQAAYDVVQYRALQKEITQEKREARRKSDQEREQQKLRDSVAGPDSPEAVKVWMDVMGKKPGQGITEIYATKSQGWGMNYLSFLYRDKEDLVAALSPTHWSEALNLLSEDCANDFDAKQPPPWPKHWPMQPLPDAKVGGRAASRPFVSDGYYYYLDPQQNLFFLATGMTHDELWDYIKGKLERNQ